VEPLQQIVERFLERLSVGVPGEVVELPRVLLQVVELAPAVLVLDVELSSRLDGDVRRWTAVVQEVLAEVLLEERVTPRGLLAVEEGRDAAAVFGKPRPDSGQ